LNDLIFLGVLAAAFGTGFILRAKGMNWFVAWLVASIVIPTILYISEVFDPTGWLGVAGIFGTLYGIFLGGCGVLAAVLATRKRDEQPAP
jgi:hypothetical protein